MSCMQLNDIRSFDRPSASRRKTTARCEVRSVSSKSGQRDAYSTPSFFYAITVHASATVRSHHGTPDVIIVRLAKRPETRRRPTSEGRCARSAARRIATKTSVDIYDSRSFE